METQLRRQKGEPLFHFSAHVYCGQTARYITIPLGTEVGLGPGDIVLDGDPATPESGTAAPIFGPCLLCPNGWTDQDATWYGDKPRPKPHYVIWGPSYPPKRSTSLFSAHVCCGQTDGSIKMPLGTEIGLDPGHIVSDRAQVPTTERGTAAPPPLGR